MLSNFDERIKFIDCIFSTTIEIFSWYFVFKFFLKSFMVASSYYMNYDHCLMGFLGFWICLICLSFSTKILNEFKLSWITIGGYKHTYTIHLSTISINDEDAIP